MGKRHSKTNRKILWMPHQNNWPDVISFFQEAMGCVRTEAADFANAEKAKFFAGKYSLIVWVECEDDAGEKWTGWKGRETGRRGNRGGHKGPTLRDILTIEIGRAHVLPEDLREIFERLFGNDRRKKYVQAVNRGIIKSYQVRGFSFWMLSDTVPPTTLAEVQCISVADKRRCWLEIYGGKINGLAHNPNNRPRESFVREESQLLRRILEMNGMDTSQPKSWEWAETEFRGLRKGRALEYRKPLWYDAVSFESLGSPDLQLSDSTTATAKPSYNPNAKPFKMDQDGFSVFGFQIQGREKADLLFQMPPKSPEEFGNFMEWVLGFQIANNDLIEFAEHKDSPVHINRENEVVGKDYVAAVTTVAAVAVVPEPLPLAQKKWTDLSPAERDRRMKERQDKQRLEAEEWRKRREMETLDAEVS